MNNKFTYDFTKKAIVGTKTSIKKANAGKNPEYSELCEKLKAHPDFVVIEKIINQKKKKKTYNSLTLKKMEEYISTQPESTNKLIEFKAIQKVAEARGAKYPLCKKWFLNTYPEYKENAISSEQTKALITEEDQVLAKAEAAIDNLNLADEDFCDNEVEENKLRTAC